MKLFFPYNKKGQNIIELPNLVVTIVLIGILIGIGVLLLEKFGAATSYERTKYNDTVLSSEYRANGTILASLAWGNITNVRYVLNGTGGLAVNPICYDINETFGQLAFYNDTIEATGNCMSVNGMTVIYDYKDYNTATKAATAAVSVELISIPNSWIGLIITIVILSLVLFLVIKSFNPNAGR